MENFIKNKKLLNEDHRISDLFNFNDYTKSFEDLMLSINKSGIIGLIGGYGTGKSTLLYQLEKKDKENKEGNSLWITFDAWKFPDRHNLWEGFVLEFAKQIDKETFDAVRKEIEGEKGRDVQSLINVVAGTWNLFLPGGDLIKNLNHFFKTSPDRRTFEIQEILEALLKKLPAGSKVNIVVEDVDRSGDNGVFFLETLHQFLNNLELENEVRVLAIAPISDKNYYDRLDSYLKCINYFDFFDPSTINVSDFVVEAFNDDLMSDEIKKGQIVSFLNILFSVIPGMTIRKLKLILRKASANYARQYFSGLDPDFRMTIIFEVMKYVRFGSEGLERDTYFKHVKQNRKLSNSQDVFAAFFYAIYSRRNDIYEDAERGSVYNSPFDFYFINPGSNSADSNNTVWKGRDMISRSGDCFYVKDFYLNY